MPLIGLFGMVVSFVAGIFVYRQWAGWRRGACDACHIERDGGTRVFIPHTCSPRRALHRNHRGQVIEFGERRGGGR